MLNKNYKMVIDLPKLLIVLLSIAILVFKNSDLNELLIISICVLLIGEFIGVIKTLFFPEPIKDVSIHFTLKGQNLDDLRDKFYESEIYERLCDEENPELTLHHCFLTRYEVQSKGLPTTIHDFLDEISETDVNWSNTGLQLVNGKWNMLNNMSKIGGVCIFIGEIKEGVKEEYDIAIQNECEIVLIP